MSRTTFNGSKCVMLPHKTQRLKSRDDYEHISFTFLVFGSSDKEKAFSQSFGEIKIIIAIEKDKKSKVIIIVRLQLLIKKHEILWFVIISVGTQT